MEVLAKNTPARLLGWLGLALVAAGMPHYAWAVYHPLWGLWAAGAGGLCLVAGGLLGRRELAVFLNKRSARLGLGAGASLLMVLAIALFLGALASRHHLRLDLTKDARHTLAPQSKELLAKLSEPVKAYAFYREGQPGRQGLRDLLEQYAFQSHQFSYQFVDPDRDPGLARRFDVRAYGSLLLSQGDRVERIKLPEEQELTSALLRLSRQGSKTVYLLGGHGEASPEEGGQQGLSQFKQAVEKQNYHVKPLVLITARQVPADAALVVVAAPQKPLLPAEAAALDEHLKRGGGLLLLLEPDRDSGLAAWLKQRGVILDDDLVLDPASSLVGASPAWPLVEDFGQHPVTKPLTGMICYFPLARSLRLAQPLPEGVRGQELLRTGPSSWGVTDLDTLKAGPARYQEGRDLKGPLSLGAVLEVPGASPSPAPGQTPPPAPRGRLTVIGDADFLTNQHLGQAANRDLALNLVSYLAEEQDLISLRPRQDASQPLLLTPGQGIVLFGLPVVVLPLIFLGLGVVVVRRRRRRL
ncbi:MAG: GldG family protein [Pseudomonadota bacterium]